MKHVSSESSLELSLEGTNRKYLQLDLVNSNDLHV